MSGELIRFWTNGFNPAGHAVADFDRGFTLPLDHPVARMIHGTSALSDLNITVSSTTEFHWKIDSWYSGRSGLRVVCEAWIEGLRRKTVSDEWFLKNVH